MPAGPARPQAMCESARIGAPPLPFPTRAEVPPASAIDAFLVLRIVVRLAGLALAAYAVLVASVPLGDPHGLSGPPGADFPKRSRPCMRPWHSLWQITHACVLACLLAYAQLGLQRRAPMCLRVQDATCTRARDRRACTRTEIVRECGRSLSLVCMHRSRRTQILHLAAMWPSSRRVRALSSWTRRRLSTAFGRWT